MLAGKLIDGVTKDTVAGMLDTLGTLGDHKSAPPVEAIQVIYNGTLERDPARGMIAQLFIHYGDGRYAKELLAASSADLPNDFLRELAMGLLPDRPLPKDVKKDE